MRKNKWPYNVCVYRFTLVMPVSQEMRCESSSGKRCYKSTLTDRL